MAGYFLVLFLVLLPQQTEQSVFLSASKANEVLMRWKRASSYLLEELFEGNLEKECYEEICVYEEAREVFENDLITNKFWKWYMGGTQCVSQPCLNNGSCHDNIRSYTCNCSHGYEGRNCAYATNECHPERSDGCQHFCHPGQRSYICSCAQGYKVGADDKSCIPSEKCACGILNSKCSTTLTKDNKNLQHFPWQVKLTNSQGEDFCGGVLIQDTFVLTTAKCSLVHRNISVTINFNRTSNNPLTIKVKKISVHMRYSEDTGENNVSLLELEEPVQCPSMGLPICVPENDFAEHILIPRKVGLVSGWTVNGTELVGSLMKLPVEHLGGDECGEALNVTVTTRMYCERSELAARQWAEGSIVTREHQGAWFLTGLMYSAPAEEYERVFLFTKISRYLLWFRQIMNH
ncbi:PREDICTED: vitamin K-dependent protein Z [Chrysochloris asiatica]|uniref:Vitamin K-dependent protein Z n=1 Tax=Chrysochloris asiatica TaxID=185453 RepID=A0A9B0T804_CHRAS|nr:PREDICTED: vitamin K-dependent protein Z [Chrysochloris asiatica]